MELTMISNFHHRSPHRGIELLLILKTFSMAKSVKIELTKVSHELKSWYKYEVFRFLSMLTQLFIREVLKTCDISQVWKSEIFHGVDKIDSTKQTKNWCIGFLCFFYVFYKHTFSGDPARICFVKIPKYLLLFFVCFSNFSTHIRRDKWLKDQHAYHNAYFFNTTEPEYAYRCVMLKKTWSLHTVNSRNSSDKNNE